MKYLSLFAFPAVALGALLLLAGCSNSTACEDCVCPGGEHLAEDIYDVRGLYTTDGLPVAVLRYDFAGECFGSGQRAFVIYRPEGLQIPETADIDAFRAPRHVPDTFRYEYDAGVAIVTRQVAENAMLLTFDDGSERPLTARCEVTDGITNCVAL